MPFLRSLLCSDDPVKSCDTQIKRVETPGYKHQVLGLGVVFRLHLSELCFLYYSLGVSPSK